jgi:hypothetical protein
MKLLPGSEEPVGVRPIRGRVACSPQPSCPGCLALRFIWATARARREPFWKLASLLRVVSAEPAVKVSSWSGAALRIWPDGGVRWGSPEGAGASAVGDPVSA